MSEKIYFATVNGNLIDNYDLANVALITTGKRIEFGDFNALRKFAETCKGVKFEVKKPSVEYLVKYGRTFKAMMLYHDQHPECKIAECRKVIEDMEKNLKEKKNE